MRLSRLLTLLCFASTLFAADPFLGTWKLNTEKSRYVPGPTPQTLTMVWTQEGDGTRVRTDGMLPTRRPIKEQYVAFYNGKERESKGPWNFDSVINSTISEHQKEDIFKRKGAVIGTCKLEVSADGKTLTQRWDFGEMKDVRVFDRQQPTADGYDDLMVILNGRQLSVEQVYQVAVKGERVEIAAEARERMLASRVVVERLADGDEAVYGVNTGVGLLADVRISHDELEQLQRNIVRSHAVGVGRLLERSVVRAMMLIRANVLAIGCSGIRPVVAERLCDLLNHGVTPLVPSRGSAGASGDLAPLAHMALVLIGEGEAEFAGAQVGGPEALKRAGLEPLTLKAKEGISLVNGTQAMLAIACLELRQAEILTDTADLICAMSLDGLKGTPRAFDPRIHEARPHRGQLRSAANLTRILEDSEIRASHMTCRRVQDAYSLRCAPQVHGAVRDTLAEARRVFEIELNSVTDNPLVFGDEIISGGNFHGQPLALNLDYMAIGLTALGGFSERRIDRLVNPALNEDLPAFLANHAGLESGFMMVQVTAAALVAENRVLSNPASPGSITTSGNKEDFVSMGMTSALKLQQVMENTRNILAIEAITAARALDCLKPLKSSPTVEQARERLRTAAPEWREDQVFSGQIRATANLIANAVLAELLQC